MKKLINDPLKVADELIDGLVEAYDGDCVKVGTRSIVKKEGRLSSFLDRRKRWQS